MVVLVSINLVSVAQASPPAQDPRPPVDTGGGGGAGGAGGGGGNNGLGGGGTPGCALVNGQVTNWGFGPQSNIGVELKTGSWRADTISASDGNFGFGGLGVGLARLHVAIAPGDAKRLKPLIQDAGVYLNCNYQTIANIAVYSGDQVTPPATIEMAASSAAIVPGDDFNLTLTVKNGLPTDITNVIVTDMMPPGLKAVQVSSSVKPQEAQIVDGGADGQLVVVNLERLASKAKATITIKVNADIDLLNGTAINNTATLFYRESFAHQASLDFTVGSAAEPIQAAAGSRAGAGSELVPPATAPTTGGDLLPGNSTEPEGKVVIPASSAVAPVKEAAASANSVPPGGMPSTGADLLATLNPAPLAQAVTPLDQVVTLEMKEQTTSATYQPKAEGDTSVQVIANDKAVSSGPPLTLAIGFLFLGLLALGSGLTYLNRRTP
jgi:uncharacterized repeat protein (TIGR01451 family)